MWKGVRFAGTDGDSLEDEQVALLIFFSVEGYRGWEYRRRKVYGFSIGTTSLSTTSLSERTLRSSTCLHTGGGAGCQVRTSRHTPLANRANAEAHCEMLFAVTQCAARKHVRPPLVGAEANSGCLTRPW